MPSPPRQIPFGRPIIGEAERRAVDEILQDPILVHGPRGRQFEQAFETFVGGGLARAVSSCTAGLHLAWFHLGLGPGDEVIVPAQTHVATAHAVELTGAKPVFVDADPLTGNLDLDQVELCLTPRTRGLSLVHFLGLPVEMERAMAMARRHNLFVVEDCALALGTYYKGVHAGLWGDVGCFSFYPVKHMTTAEGGMVLTRDPELASAVGLKRAFGVDRNPQERKEPGIYDVVELGFNYRMSEIAAGIGLEQLKRLPGFLEKREENYRILAAALAELEELEFLWAGDVDFVSSRYCLSVILKQPHGHRRPGIVASLKEQGVGSSVYYPRPVPHMSYYRAKYGYPETSFPEAARISNRSIALPVGPHLEGEDMLYIAAAMKTALKGGKGK
jgi:dTDP-4-amino-4,6-dideoxygalactose transaminase